MEDGRLQLSDFGLVKNLAPSERSLAGGGKSSTAAIKGTLDYMAPEQFHGRPVGKPADVYSLGIMLAELATGQRPRKPDNYPRRGSHLHRFRPLQVLPEELRAFLERCTQTEPDKRPPDGRAVVEQFDSIFQNQR
jgi:serine/threonine protein kinase